MKCIHAAATESLLAICRDKTMTKTRSKVTAFLLCAMLIVCYAIYLVSSQPVQIRISPSNNIHSVTADDIEVYKSFLAQLNKDRSYKDNKDITAHILDNDIKTWILAGDKTPIRLVNTTATAKDIGPLDRFKEEHGTQPRNDKFNSLRKSLMERNATSVSIPKFASALRVTFAPPSRFGLDDHQDEWDNCDIHFSLPVYTADHSLAMVYFYSEAGTSLDQGEIYIMRRRDKSWFVDTAEVTMMGPESLGR